jgi:hypothetical protein
MVFGVHGDATGSIASAEHARSVLRFLFEYGALAPTPRHDVLPWRLALRRDVIEVHAAHAITEASDFDTLLVECGGAIAIARLVLARIGFASTVAWGMREGTHVASVCATEWSRDVRTESHESVVDGWRKLAALCGASLEIAPSARELAATRAPRPLAVALSFAIEGTRGALGASDDDALPLEDGYVVRLRTNRRGPAGLVALGHAAASVALDASANGYTFASGALERTDDCATLPIALGRRALAA